MSPVLKPCMVDFISHSEDQTRRLGTRLGNLVQAGQFIALLGDLGAGKTCMAQGFGIGLGLPEDEIINSPTFTFINEYYGRLPLYHIDLYRLNESIEAETLGLDDYYYGDGVCLVEWADRLADALPTEYLQINIYHLNNTKRRIVMQAHGAAYERLLRTFQKMAFRA